MELTREAILQADDSQKTRVDVPEWGGHVYVRVMSGTQRGLLEKLTTSEQPYDVRAAVIAATLCAADGVPLFDDPADVPSLAGKTLEPLNRIFEAASRLNKLGAEGLETATKNSASSQSDDSGFSLPASSAAA